MNKVAKSDFKKTLKIQKRSI